ncbi:DUF4416 family protein [candidate division KSB1 bacterium]|nr:DUF4416 family protein [candidate division KSB1 bacterium]
MKPQPPQPVKFFCGVLYSDENLTGEACDRLQEKYGAIDYQSPSFPFDVTDYYVAEMGAPILRCFWSFRKLTSPKILAESKVFCSRIEDHLSVDGRRRINLDPGYMDYDKVVLASAKYNAQKIYLDLGIYADLTLRYEKGVYKPSEYAFPDFKSGLYNDVFLHIRAKYKGQLRRMMREDSGRE